MFADIIQEAQDIQTGIEHLYPVYVVLTFSGTTLSNVIKKVTHTPYSHTSISFTPSMKNMHSFGRGKITRFNLLDAGFASESLKDIKMAKGSGDDITYSIYVTFATRQEREMMIQKVKEISDLNDQKKLKYNFIGLIYNKFGKEYNRDDAYFCSEFVETILKAGGKGFDNKHASLVRPYDYTRLKKFQFTIRGRAQLFDEDKLKQRVLQVAPEGAKIHFE